MNGLILFPTLNGRVLIVSTTNYEVIKNITVDPDSRFNNIISLNVIEDLQTLIIASPNKIVSISPKETIVKDYTLRDIIVVKDRIYIATVDGQIIKLNPSLEQLAKKKYKYAKFHAIAFTNSIYAVESQGYLINIAEDFSKDTVYKFSFNNEKRMINMGNKIYFDHNFITLP